MGPKSPSLSGMALPLLLLLMVSACNGGAVLHNLLAKDPCRLTQDKLVCKDYRSSSLEMSQVMRSENYEPDVASRIVHLDVKNGNTPNIPRGAFSVFKAVTQLQIRNMSVSAIDVNAFAGLSAIKLLDLSHNNIRFFHASTFRSIGVRHLKLDGNPYLQVPTNSPLLIAPKLQWLSLRHCGIEHLPGVAFQGTPHLSHLDLSSNHLELLPQVLFENTTLTALDISHNEFRTISMGMFQRIPHFPSHPRSVIVAGNHWHCDCRLSAVIRWLAQDLDTHFPTSDPARSRLQVPTTCASPPLYAGTSWHAHDQWECNDKV